MGIYSIHVLKRAAVLPKVYRDILWGHLLYGKAEGHKIYPMNTQGRNGKENGKCLR